MIHTKKHKIHLIELDGQKTNRLLEHNKQINKGVYLE